MIRTSFHTFPFVAALTAAACAAPQRAEPLPVTAETPRSGASQPKTNGPAVSNPAPPTLAGADPVPSEAAAPSSATDAGAIELRRFAGQWTTRVTWTSPGFPDPLTWDGVSQISLLGERWLVSHHEGSFLDMGFEAYDVMGYDTRAGLWSSVWVDQFNDYMVKLSGPPGDGAALVLTGQMQDDRGTWMDLQRTVTWIDDDTFVMRFATIEGDREIMRIHFIRARSARAPRAAAPR